MVPKIFAYLVFAFGFVPFIFGFFNLNQIGSNVIVPSLVILPLVLSIVRSIIYCLSKRNRSLRWSMLFGFSTMYVLNERNFDDNQLRPNESNNLPAIGKL